MAGKQLGMREVTTVCSGRREGEKTAVLTREGRGSERLRRIAWTACAAGGARLIGLVAPLITIPVTLRYLGPEQYGIWMTIGSVTAFFVFADLGLGNGLLTAVSRANGRDDRMEMRRYISCAFFILLGVGLAAGIVLVVLYQVLPWGQLLSIRNEADRDAGAAAAATALLVFAAGLPVSIIQKAQLGLQRGSETSVWQMIGSLVSVIAILIAVRWRASLAGLVFCSAGVSWIFMVANFISFFWITDRDLAPRLQSVDGGLCRELVAQGSQYVMVSLLWATCYTCDNLILAHVLGQQAVTAYSVPFRLVSILASVPTMVLMPLWSANGEALERGDFQWVRDNIKRMTMVLSAITLGGGLVVLLGGPVVLASWFGLQERTDVVLLLGLVGMAWATALAGPHFMVLNAAGEVWIQVKLYAVLTPLYLVGKILGAMYLGSRGPAVAGAVIGLLLLYPCVRGQAVRSLERRASIRLKPVAGCE